MEHIPSTLRPDDGSASPSDRDVRDVLLEGNAVATRPHSSPKTDRAQRTAGLLHGRDGTLLQLGLGA